LPGAHERFLHGILRQVGRPEDQPSDRIQTITSGGREGFESLVITAGGGFDEISPHFPLHHRHGLGGACW
jgi:hypothetical protein